jgi:hypothetical protein
MAGAPSLGDVNGVHELPYPLLSSSVSPAPLGVVVRVLDANNATLAGGSADARTRVLATAPPGVQFIGMSGVQCVQGVADFSTLTLKAAPGTYTITFGAEQLERWAEATIYRLAGL